MTSELALRGVYVPLITPFAADGTISLGAMERLAHEYLDAGAAGLVPLGTTGESPALDAAEKRAVVDVCSRVCVERGVPLVVGAGTNNTATTVAAVKALAGTPALAATLIVVPYYVRPSEAGIVAHYRAVAAASPVPIILYNIPYRTGRGIGSASILELARTPNVAGIKQAVGGIDADTLRVLADLPDGFALLGGEDPYLFPTVLLGGSGAIAASAHVCTERFVAMIECGLAGKLDEGRAYEESLLPVVEACFAEPNPSVFKGVLHAQGRIPTPDLRLPLLPASGAAVERALAAIAAVV
ncbi:MAG: 4-hydroxy-tetrahydrodipicolinate synthase [Acidimicrobiia bacterium]